jgi:hypothetical protein
MLLIVLTFMLLIYYRRRARSSEPGTSGSVPLAPGDQRSNNREFSKTAADFAILLAYLEEMRGT